MDLKKLNLKLEEEISEWLQLNLGHENFTPGLERFQKIYQDHFSAIFKKTKVVTIAGTNGKGEVAHALNFLLKERGIKTALWTSPHILSVSERFIINGMPYPSEKLFEKFKESNEELGDVCLSYYEFLFFNFLKIAGENEIEMLILEVGLGGRLDAVNVLDSVLTAIVSISRDHLEILGKEYRTILREKLGITRRGIPLVTSFETKYLQGIARKYTLCHGVPYLDLFEQGILKRSYHFQSRNYRLALSLEKILTERIDFKDTRRLVSQLEESISRFDFTLFPTSPGRMQELTWREKNFLFFNSHNLDGIRKLINYISVRPSFLGAKCDTILLSFSKRPLWEIEAFLELLKELDRKIVITSYHHPKAFTELFRLKGKDKCVILDDWKDYLERRSGKENILCTGSNYFIGEVQKYILSK